ncbi:MAG TPA: leucyl aminopeptidase [Micropepsaceae bacterium]|nr:leucyl aminopeptidase [Micropepsaceae bacterium]
MDISFATPGASGPGALVVGVLDGGELTEAAVHADKATGGAIKRALAVSRFKGRTGQSLELLAPAGVKASRIVLAGLGKPDALGPAAAERLAAEILGRLLSGGEETLTFAIDLPKKAKLNEGELAAHLALGAFLRSYRFDHYRKVKDDEKPSVKKVIVLTSETAAAKKAWAGLAAVGEGIFLARDLVNEPANILYPDEFASRTRALKKLGVKIDVFDVPAMKKLGMNALLGVGQGSAFDSRMVVMQWNGAPKGTGKDKAPLAFIGKGVSFDSGGLSLKPANSMMGMKGDMGGAAAVVGLMHALAKRKAKVDAVGLIGLVENMPDGKAQRPNDIVKTMSGQTIEVLNTDAEGRLVLADVLWYAQSRFKPRFMIDLATLTGAILVALGAEHAGLFSNNDELSERLTKAGLAEGEPVWRLPLGDGYDRLVKSKIADMKNIGGPNAGSITAAQILQRFVNKVPWAHLDIAGVAWQDGEQKPLAPSWGTGWGVRVLNRLVADNYEN